LRKDPTLSEADLKYALQVSQIHPKSPVQLNVAGWKVVKTRDAGKDAYAFGLCKAEAAVRLAPENGLILNRLGVT
jgi:hypothetical protein